MWMVGFSSLVVLFLTRNVGLSYIAMRLFRLSSLFLETETLEVERDPMLDEKEPLSVVREEAPSSLFRARAPLHM